MIDRKSLTEGSKGGTPPFLAIQSAVRYPRHVSSVTVVKKVNPHEDS